MVKTSAANYICCHSLYPGPSSRSGDVGGVWPTFSSTPGPHDAICPEIEGFAGTERCQL